MSLKRVVPPALAVWLIIAVLSTSVALALDDDCTFSHEITNNYYDLRSLKREQGEDWTIKDSKTQYLLNVCHKILYPNSGLKNADATGAIVTGDPKVSSLGEYNTRPYLQGDKLVLEYKSGDPCPNTESYKKTTLISFICDKTVDNLGQPVFVGQSNDCGYFFEWRTPAACPTKRKIDTMGGWSVFLTIMFIAISVYLIGGVIYNRIIYNASGVYQLPHWEFWKGCWDFTCDMALIVLANCPIRPRRSPRNYRGLPNDDEAGLIEEFDEH